MLGKALTTDVIRPPDDWFERCRYWLTLGGEKATLPRRARIQDRRPLILTGHGMHLRVHRGTLVVRNGFTHYPQKIEEQRFFPGARDLPSRIVVVDGNGSLSFDVLSWLSEQQIQLVRLDWKGNVTSVVGGNYALDHERVVEQQQALLNRLAIATQLIRQKLRNSLQTLELSVPPSNSRSAALERTRTDLKLLAATPSKSIRELLGIEGRCAYAYFNAWQELPVKWKGAGRHPIPDDWYFAGPRRSRVGNKTGNRNRRASHPVNAMLNYAYAVLESQIRIRILAEGYDPKLGFLHASSRKRDAFVLDLMEPLRPIVDRAVLTIMRGHVFHASDFDIRSDGVCRLNSELARHLVRCACTVIDTANARQAMRQGVKTTTPKISSRPIFLQ